MSDTQKQKVGSKVTRSFEAALTQVRKTQHCINPILRVILEGVYDNGSPLSLLRGTPHIIQSIWQFITCYWRSLIKIGSDTHIPTPSDMTPGTIERVPQNKFFLEVKAIEFPKPQNLNINMMPFKNVAYQIIFSLTGKN